MARPREHEFECRKDGEVVILTVPFGDSPKTPKCPTCGASMTKVWGTTQFSYSRKWRISMGR